MSYNGDNQLEEQMILRLPPQLADQVRKMLRGKQLTEDIEFEFESNDNRTAKFKVGKKKYDAYVVDLPCIVESHKTLDKTTYYKSADIGQMLVVQDPKDPVPPPPDFKSPNGITTASRDIQRRKWKKPPDPAQLREIENEINRLLKPAENETVEILNADDIDDLDELVNYTENVNERSEISKIKLKVAEDGNVEHFSPLSDSISPVTTTSSKKASSSRKKSSKKKEKDEEDEEDEEEKAERERKAKEDKKEREKERRRKKRKEKKEKKEEEDAAVPQTNGEKPKEKPKEKSDKPKTKRAPSEKKRKPKEKPEPAESHQVPTSPPAAFAFSNTITQPPPPLPQVPSAFTQATTKISTPSFNANPFSPPLSSSSSSVPSSPSLSSSSSSSSSTPISITIARGPEGKPQLQAQQKKLQADVDQLKMKVADATNKYNILPNAVLRARFQVKVDEVTEQYEQKMKELQEVERQLSTL